MLRGLQVSPLFSLVVLSVTATTAAAQTGMDSDKQSIQAVAQDWAEAFSGGDVEGIMGCWSEDPIMMSPGRTVVGKAAIQERFEEDLRTGRPAEASISFDEVEVAGDWAFARGVFQSTWTPVDGGEVSDIRNDNLLIMRRGGEGTWKISRMMWHPASPTE